MSLPEMWCPACQEWTSLIDKRVCAWCDGPLVKRRRVGGWTRPDLRARARLSEEQLVALHSAYVKHGVSVNDLAKRVWENAGFASYGAAATAIYKGWKRLGLPTRDRIDAVKKACTIHGLAPKHGPRPAYATYKRRQHRPDQPPCIGVKTNPPGVGTRCSRPASFGSEYCVNHDPAREQERQAALAAMRARKPDVALLPMGPFVAWLHELRAEYGSFRAVAELVGMHRSQCYRFSQGLTTGGDPKATISLDVVKRSAEAAGTTVDAIYAREAVAA